MALSQKNYTDVGQNNISIFDKDYLDMFMVESWTMHGNNYNLFGTENWQISQFLYNIHGSFQDYVVQTGVKSDHPLYPRK